MLLSGRSRSATRAFLALLALAAPGFARELTVTTEPAAVATWAEPIHVIVQGTSATACGAAAVSLVAPRIGPTGAVGYIQVRETCNVPGPVLAEPFAAELDLGLLVPALHQLVVRDEDGSFAGTSLEVGSPGTAVVDVVERPAAIPCCCACATSAAPPSPAASASATG